MNALAVILWSSGLYSIKCLCSRWWPILQTNLSAVLHSQGNLEMYCPVGSYVCPNNHIPDKTMSLSRRPLYKNSLLWNTQKFHTPVMSIPTIRFKKKSIHTYIRSLSKKFVQWVSGGVGCELVAHPSSSLHSTGPSWRSVGARPL